VSSPPLAFCALVPIYDNRDTIADVLARLAVFSLPCLVVDDGSNQATRTHLDELAAADGRVLIKHLPRNGGKGAAVMAGLLWAEELGYSHALQVDADGQHKIEDTPRFLEATCAQPEALILGKPVFGADVPKARLYGRQISRVMVHVETLSTAVGDPLFGFRIYPVAASANLIRRVRLGTRMDFDTDILVRLVWEGLPVVNLNTPVTYPPGGISHFRMLRDNVLLTWLHIRLTLGMILRIPRLLGHERKV